MTKNTLLLIGMMISNLMFAQDHTFTTDTNVYVIPDNVQVILVNVNDAGNSAAVPAGIYGSYTITADWSISSGDAWSNEERLTVTTSGGTTTAVGPTSGGAASTASTTLTFSGNLPSNYDPSVNGLLELGLSRTYDSPSNWTNITVTIGPVIPPPSNDECSTAIALTPGIVFGDNPIDATVDQATYSGFTNSCGGTSNMDNDIWFSVVAPNDGNITLEVGPDSGTGNTSFDSVIEAYTSDTDCSGTLTSVGCDDDGADTGLFSRLSLTGLTAGEVVYIRVWEFSSDETEPFSISAYSSTLSVSEKSLNSFEYFPNPATNKLTLKAQQNIQHVSVFNMLGQEVMRTNMNVQRGELDMSSLQSGHYFVKVSINSTVETLKIIKK